MSWKKNTQLRSTINLPVDDSLTVKVLQSQNDLCQIETGCVLHENALSLQMHEQLPTAEVFENQVELAARLEGVNQVHNEWVLDRLQNVPLRLGVGSVLLVAHNGRLLQHFHGKYVAGIFAGHLAHLEHFPVPAPAQNSAELKVLRSSLFCSGVDGILGQLNRLYIGRAVKTNACVLRILYNNTNLIMTHSI